MERRPVKRDIWVAVDGNYTAFKTGRAVRFARTKFAVSVWSGGPEDEEMATNRWIGTNLTVQQQKGPLPFRRKILQKNHSVQWKFCPRTNWNYFLQTRCLVSNETVVLRRWGSETQNFGFIN